MPHLNTASADPNPPTAILWPQVPAWYREHDDGTLRNLLAAFEQQLHSWRQRLQQTTQLHDPQHTPTWALDLLLRTWGFDPPARLQPQQKRRLLRWVVLLHRRTATAAGIQQAVRAITTLHARCWPLQQGWCLDSDETLDHTAQLADSLDHPQQLYAFDLQVHGQLTQQQQQAVRRMVDTLRPVHCPLRNVLQCPTPLQQAALRLLGRCALYVLRQQQRDGSWADHTSQQLVVLAHALRDAAAVLPWQSLQRGWQRAAAYLSQQQHVQDAACLPHPHIQRLDRARGLLCTRNAPVAGRGSLAPLQEQAAALWAWQRDGQYDHAQALLAGVVRLPFYRGAPLDPATQQPAALSGVALLLQALTIHCQKR